MVPELAALRSGAAALLRARGSSDLADLVERGDLELSRESQTWLVGSRTVMAHVVALVLPAAELAELTRATDSLDRVRQAFAQAMASPSMALAELVPILRLPVIDRPWQTAYRSAPIAQIAQRPAPESVLAGAAELLAALGHDAAAAIATRGVLRYADVPTSGERTLVRYVLHLEAHDLAAVKRDATLAEAIRDALTDAGTRATEAVADVELRLEV